MMRDITFSEEENSLINEVLSLRRQRTQTSFKQLKYLPRDIESAVKVGMLTLGGQPPSAWKLGGTNEKTRSLFNVSRPYFGPLKSNELFKSGAKLCLSDFISPKAEPEICVALKCEIGPQSQVTDIYSEIEWISLGIEIPDSVFSDVKQGGVNVLLADRCAAGALVLGSKFDKSELNSWERQTLTFENAEGSHVASVGGGLIGGVIGSLTEALAEFRRMNITVGRHIPIATGGLTNTLPLLSGTMRCKLGKATVTLNIET